MNPATAPEPRWLQLWSRYRHLVALLSFAAGVASFVLVQRQERVAQALIVLLPLSWLAALAETQWLQHAQHRWLRHSQALLRYVNQALHQESFFFTLPFFLATTSWTSPQALFVLTLMALALASMIDPLYFRRVVVNRPLLWLFHACAAFVTVLTAAPMLWQIDTGTSLLLAIAAGGSLSLPMFHALLRDRPPPWRGPLALTLSALLAASLWSLRPAIPPATLSVHDARLAFSIDADRREPGAAAQRIGAQALLRHGLYAWTPIHAPRGLDETIEHQWWHDGQLVDRIPIDIRGGREQGYRAWTHKTAFGADPRGRWQVRVVTQSDQMIGLLRFSVQ